MNKFVQAKLILCILLAAVIALGYFCYVNYQSKTLYKTSNTCPDGDVCIGGVCWNDEYPSYPNQLCTPSCGESCPPGDTCDNNTGFCRKFPTIECSPKACNDQQRWCSGCTNCSGSGYCGSKYTPCFAIVDPFTGYPTPVTCAAK